MSTGRYHENRGKLESAILSFVDSPWVLMQSKDGLLSLLRSAAAVPLLINDPAARLVAIAPMITGYITGEIERMRQYHIIATLCALEHDQAIMAHGNRMRFARLAGSRKGAYEPILSTTERTNRQ